MVEATCSFPFLCSWSGSFAYFIEASCVVGASDCCLDFTLSIFLGCISAIKMPFSDGT